ncbi:hypothetical protein HUT03_03840 [Candidatus Liberibacter africanus]|uniref:Uncharacterized protein n=1 Tax=Candidatus Liberibacter africanus PTSAPSY TaxID=1277257 RepID=A0A0G3I9F5_LIBAF|nr:hypothetical protein [Candidatus Liberibacter africanus]AKK20387.1 hypothetical protein G293_03805 [Candidatus Liberibacter africanus PTSAPSY]QTP64122.1 hypothetical protein HUT03_03840 [Candidatus Liberibacter africanus]
MSTLENYRIRTVLKRAIAVIDNENNNFKNNIQFDINVSNDLKGRCLHELSTCFLSCEEMSRDHAEQIRILHEKLELNSSLLESYLEAARAVADLFKKKLQDMDADGTYQDGFPKYLDTCKTDM